jgi:LEA14-like dessication related protein
MINYGDGNGNQYIIEQESVEYTPVKPKFSSSGIYDGGDHVKKLITQLQYDKITSIFKKAIANKASHIKNRVKMSGAITIKEGNTVNSCILSPNSEELNEIEKILKDIIKN